MADKGSLEEKSCNAQEHWENIQRIAQSQLFHRAARIRELLLYLADRSLHGSPDELTEAHIADKVFHRRDYNPTEDNLVRATIRQLRLKLMEYFETEGKDESWIAELPKGSHQISFKPRPLQQTTSAARHPSRSVFILVVALAICSTAAAITLGFRHSGAPAAAPKRQPTLMDLLVAHSKQPTQIVVLDSALVLLEGFAGQDIGLQEYASRTYASKLDSAIGFLPESDRKLLDSRQITSFSDVEIASRICRAYGSVYPIRVRHARSMNTRDFQSGNNFVLIGSPMSNPWVALFNQNLNFQFDNQTDSWPVIRNRHPRPGERSVYGAGGYSETGMQYARIAMLHSKSGSGRVALIAGTSMEGTEAAGKAFLKPGFASSLAKRLHIAQVTSLPDFEVLIKSEGVGGAGYGARIVAVREIANQF